MPAKRTDGWEPSFSHWKIIYLPLTISLFLNHSTTAQVFGASMARLPAVIDREFAKSQASHKPAITAQYSDSLSDVQVDFKIIPGRLLS